MDTVLMGKDLLPYKWYIENLEHTYPNANIPVIDILQPDHLITANPDRDVCYISADNSLRCT
jgi:hypothetical protein